MTCFFFKFQFIALLNITDCLSGQSYPICIPDKIQYPDFRCCILFSGDGMRYEVLKFENIRNLRIDNGYTQKQITAYLGISQNTYSQYEIGTNRFPLEAVMVLAEFYGTSMDYLVGLTDERRAYPRRKA